MNASLRSEYSLYRLVDPGGPEAGDVIGVSWFIIAPPYPAEVADTYSARCAGPQGITVLDAFECWHYQHGLRHMGEIELARGFQGLGGMTA